jgi:hypothetical protein
MLPVLIERNALDVSSALSGGTKADMLEGSDRA